jgi:hypothetical protein
MSNIDCLNSTCQVYHLTKRERENVVLPLKIAESDSLVMVCVDLVGPFTILTLFKTCSWPPVTGLFEIVKATNKLVAFIQDLFHNIWLDC